MNDKLEQHHVLFAGPKSRMFLAAVFYLVVLSGYGFITWRFPDPKVFPVAILMLVVLPNAIIWLFPWDRIFPGTLVTRDEIGLLDKYAPLFTFLSFLVTIAAILWQVIVSRHKRLQQTS